MEERTQPLNASFNTHALRFGFISPVDISNFPAHAMALLLRSLDGVCDPLSPTPIGNLAWTRPCVRAVMCGFERCYVSIVGLIRHT